MKNCIECNYKFTFKDRLKSTLRGRLKCKDCKSEYREKPSIYSFIYTFLVLFIVMMLQSEMKFENSILNMAAYMIVTVPTLLLFSIVPHRLHRYKKIN
ncbi:hypothetical protein QOZ83_01705 [Romboutsia sedimentorum]|uniref:TIGR04104 family putative zinc finger protein n=1 Tax=Romboutsia sedimentorum TaxID=1368474 RepID=UPI0024DEE4E8|nr:TIGR04104 family putative zinc finger protein [Romboutsia sedimentorum]MDK2584563.1 hypothetical protein [Romboutsia sedimentorum]